MDEQTFLDLMVDLHREGARQGPGSEQETLRALELARIDASSSLQVADIGCGTGASTLVLARHLPNARITAIDLFPEFLHVLDERARRAGVQHRIETRECSMDALNFQPGSLDLIWSEGAIYNIGFKNGIEYWRGFLDTGGVMAVSEITWIRPDPPDEIRNHWESEYEEISTAAEKIKQLEQAGLDLLGYFPLPANCWIENYYAPIGARTGDFLSRHEGLNESEEIVTMHQHEAALYERFQQWFSYGFYVARKR